MIRNAFIALSTGALLSASVSAAETWPVDWTISPARSGAGNAVQLALSYKTPRGGQSMNSRTRSLKELQGLSPAQLSSNGSPVRFRIVREAGTLDCAGLVRRGRGTGECGFSADPGFAAALERRSIGRPTLQQHYQLAMQDVGLPLVDELNRQGYERPTVNKLVAAGIHGVSLPYVRSIGAAGYRLKDVDGLVKFRIHGVDADYVREISALDRSRRFSPDQVVAMRIHGVSADKARQFAQLGYSGIPHDKLMAMSIHGVTPDFIREMAAAGYRGLSADQLVAMRIHGVKPSGRRR